MKPQEYADAVNEIINAHYSRLNDQQGGPRYFPKTFVTADFFEDEEVIADIKAIAEKLVDKPATTSKKKTTKKTSNGYRKKTGQATKTTDE